MIRITITRFDPSISEKEWAPFVCRIYENEDEVEKASIEEWAKEWREIIRALLDEEHNTQ